ncbi:unnamed protein product [Macrosiphum euphorbiae]|nr:unnamed protein product [Macrosiphum euphorbiae]
MNDFFSFSELLKSALNTKKFNDNGEKFVWKDIKWLRFTKNIGVLLYKDTLNADVPFKTISLLRKGHARSNLLPPLTYTKPVPIGNFCQKKKDLIELLPLIPTVFHHFYQADSQTYR